MQKTPSSAPHCCLTEQSISQLLLVEKCLDSMNIELMTCVIGGSGTDCLTLVHEMSRKQESPPSFIFSKWKGQKHRKILKEIALGSGGRL